MEHNKKRRQKGNQTLQGLYKQLPHRKNKLVSEMTGTLTASQVKGVFNGRITDPTICRQVFLASRKLIAQQKRLTIKKRKAA